MSLASCRVWKEKRRGCEGKKESAKYIDLFRFLRTKSHCKNCLLFTIPQGENNVCHDFQGKSIQLGSKKNKTPNLKFPITQKTMNSRQTLL